MNLLNIYDIFPGYTAFILGTGRSLDALSVSNLYKKEAVTIAINRAIGIAECAVDSNSLFWLVQDDWKSNRTPGLWDEWKSNMDRGEFYGLFPSVFLSREQGKIDAPKGDNIITWERDDSGTYRTHSKLKTAQLNKLFTFCGSAAPAIHAAWIMGCNEIRLVGCDGGDSVAHCLSQWYDLSKSVTANHTLSLDIARNLCHKLKLKLFELDNIGEWRENK